MERAFSKRGALVLVYLRKGSPGQAWNGEVKQKKRSTPPTYMHAHIHATMRAHRMRVVETRCSAFENEFKHAEAPVAEVSGSVNFGDKFHEVHSGHDVRARARSRTRSAYISRCTADSRRWHSSNRNRRFGSLHSIRCRDRLR